MTEHHIEHHSENAEEIAEIIDELPDNPHREEFVKFLDEGDRVLDAGCGHGQDVAYFAEKGLRAQGVDAAEGEIQEARKSYPEQDFRLEDIRDLPFEDEKYDGIWANAVLKFYPKEEMKELISELDRVLHTDGILYTSFKIGERDQVTREGENFPRYILDSVEEAEGILREAGYEIQQTYVSDDHTDYDVKVMNVFARKE